jgi:hypothetical protein
MLQRFGVSVALVLLAGPAFAKEPSLTIITEPTATISVVQDGGVPNPVNAVDGSWTLTSLYSGNLGTPVGKGMIIDVVVRAPGFASAHRTIDTGTAQVKIPLAPVQTMPDVRAIWASVRSGEATLAKLDELRSGKLAATDPETRALQAAMLLLEGSPTFDAAKAISGAEAVLKEGVTGPTQSTALATVALGRMVEWKAVASKGGDAASERAATLDAARAWVADSPGDHTAQALCISAMGTGKECGVLGDPLFR